jgi:hypothetical protein
VSPLRLVPLLALAMLASGLPAAPAAGQDLTPFQRDVNTAIDGAVAWLVNNQDQGGGWLDVYDGRGSALSAMCILERPASAFGATGEQVGYDGLSPNEKQGVRRAIDWMALNDSALLEGVGPHSNFTGVNLMALGVYAETGGPAVVGGGLTTVDQMADFGSGALLLIQGPTGGWRYTFWDDTGDVSCTQLAAAGLASVARLAPRGAAALPRLLEWVDTTRQPNGGHSYTPGRGAGAARTTTAAALWAQLVAGRPPSAAGPQSALRFLRGNWAPRPPEGLFSLYYMWTVSKALQLARNDGRLPAGVFAPQVGGALVPADEGYPEEVASWYFDLATTLLERRRDDGTWGNSLITSFACLVLERSLGGVCGDLDEDGLCVADDNCPALFNPGQDDTDGDTVGDLCDNCPVNSNTGQRDVDGDRIGNACDKDLCEPTNGGVEICDRVDNDCDAVTDNVDGELGACEGQADADAGTDAGTEADAGVAPGGLPPGSPEGGAQGRVDLTGDEGESGCGCRVTHARRPAPLLRLLGRGGAR